GSKTAVWQACSDPGSNGRLRHASETRATVNEQGLSRDEGGAFGCEECNRGGDLRRVSKPSHPDLGQGGGFALASGRVVSSEQLGLGWPRGKGIGGGLH